MTKFHGNFVRGGLTVLAGAMLAAGIGLLAGCPSQTNEPPPVAHTSGFHGVVFGGRQAIVGATVVAYATGFSPGIPPTQIGKATTDPSGTFTMSFSPSPVINQVVYVVAYGGVSLSGPSGTNNSAIGLMTIAGVEKSTLAPVVGTVNINELSTVAATAVMKDHIRFVDCDTILSNSLTRDTCLSIPGGETLWRMAQTVGNLVDVTTGQSGAWLATYSSTAGAPLRAKLEKLDTLASVLAFCVNTNGPASSACTNLFGVTGGNPDTLMAAWLIAQMPALNAKGEAIFSRMPNSPVFSPVLATAPSTTESGFWTVGGERYVVAANAGGGDVSLWRMGTSKGTLAPVPGTSCGAGLPGNCQAAQSSKPIGVAVDPTGRYLYIANYPSDYVSGWSIDTDGTLSPLIGSSPQNDCGTTPARSNCFGAGDKPYAVAVSVTANGAYVYSANNDGNSVSAFKMGADGVLTAVAGSVCSGATSGASNCFAAGSGPFSIVIDPADNYLYTANNNGGDVSAFEIGTGGVLTPVVGNACSGTSASNCFDAGGSPSAIAVTPDGHYAYVADYASQDGIQAYRIVQTTAPTTAAGALSAIGAAVAVNNLIHGLVINPSGKYLYAANTNFGQVSAWTIGAGGLLGAVAGGSACLNGDSNCFAAGNRPWSVAVDPTGRFVYAVNRNGNDVSAFTINMATGALTGISANACSGATATNCFAAGSTPERLAIDPTGRFVYVSNNGGNNVSLWTIGSAGGLIPVAHSACAVPSDPNNCLAAGSLPSFVAADPAGRFFYVTNNFSDSVSAYATQVGPVAGHACGTTPDPMNCFTAGDAPIAIAMHPSGDYAYVVNCCSNDVSAFAITATGALTSLGAAVAAGTSPSAIAVTPTGKYLYVANEAGDDISAYAIDAANGTISPITAGASACNGISGVNNCFATGDEPTSVAIDPS
ncbi:MAG: lactonase family protein, partial [Gammaproteobacteria bacterium]|nr:lactonase family protein [Gammaproteobacteria bacterium]